MLKLIIDKSRYAEEKIINQVLKSVLKREILPDDWSNCEMQQKEGDAMSYFFVYKGERLGVISRELMESDFVWTLKIIFTPISSLN